MKLTKIFVWGTVILGATAVGVYFSQVAQMTKKLFYNYKGIKIKYATLKQIVLGVTIEVENRGRLAINVKGYNFNIYADDKYLTTVTTTQPFTINPFEKSLIEFDANINTQSLSGLANVFINSASIKDIILTTDGTLTVDKFGFPIKLPIKYTEKVANYM
tara:strand:- start:811 stop:1290 length:480 start_codon:yes stop_codon:yes gene_type:complete